MYKSSLTIAGGKGGSVGRPAAPSADEWAEFCSGSLAYICPPGAELFQQGTPAQMVYLLKSGLVKLMRVEEDGQQMIVGLRSAGWLLGVESALLQSPHPVTAVALTRCDLRCVPSSQFRKMVRDDARLSWKVHQIQSREVYSQVRQLSGLGCLSARHRLEQFLWDLSAALKPAAQCREIRFQVPLRDWEVAELIAVTSSYVCRLLKELESDGLLRRRKGWIILSQPERLWHEPESETELSPLRPFGDAQGV